MEEISVVVVPFPAQGHLNQLLHLSLHLSFHGFSNIHYASSPSHVLQAKQRLQGWGSEPLQNIRFHDLESPSFPSPHATANSNTNFPTHLIPSFYASASLRAPLASLLRSLSLTCRRLVVIHDPLMSFACHEAALITNAESFRFQCVPTLNELAYLDIQGINKIRESTRLPEEFFDVLLTKFQGEFPNEFWEFLYKQKFADDKGSSGTLFNSCRAIEGDFFDQIVKIPRYLGKKLFLVGPLNPTELKGDHNVHECLEWLDKQPHDSVVYVSFGSTTTFSDEQIKELAVGLKNSNQRFIWVVRDADRGDIFANGREHRNRDLPDGFEEEIEGTGLIIRGWAPQLEILAHNATGAFMSHCGWNSCVESLSMGVPMLAWPMHSDQPRNAIMVAEYLKVGIEVRDWNRHNEVTPGDEIENAIKRMMVYDEGKEIKKKAKFIGEETRLAVLEGGSSKADFDSFVSHISR